MAKTLNLRLAGPLQSWGTDSRFEQRRTELMPTKSGVMGLVASALGRKRNEDISDLANLKFGVRVDQPGTVITDFQTVQGENDPYLTRREYLSDAKFVVSLEGEDEQLMEAIEKAIEHPVHPLFLGRRSCPPDLPLNLGLVDKPLEQALAEIPWQGIKKEEPRKFHVFLEGGTGFDARRLLDQPDSYDFHFRKYKSRVSSEKMILNKNYEEPDSLKEHDPFSVLGGD